MKVYHLLGLVSELDLIVKDFNFSDEVRTKAKVFLNREVTTDTMSSIEKFIKEVKEVKGLK